MKKGNLIGALALTFVIGVGASVYAASGSNATSYNGNGCSNFVSVTGKRGYDYVSSILKSKLGLKDSDIEKAKSDGKNLHQFANEKGLSDQDLKNAMIEARTKDIDEAVAKGTITKEQGETYKKTIKENCTNSVPGQQKGLGKGMGNCRR